MHRKLKKLAMRGVFYFVLGEKEFFILFWVRGVFYFVLGERGQRKSRVQYL